MFGKINKCSFSGKAAVILFANCRYMATNRRVLCSLVACSVGVDNTKFLVLTLLGLSLASAVIVTFLTSVHQIGQHNFSSRNMYLLRTREIYAKPVHNCLRNTYINIATELLS